MTIHDAPTPTEHPAPIGASDPFDGPDEVDAVPVTGSSAPGHEPSAPQAGTRLGYQPALDGLRGLALLAIVVFHSELPGASGAFLSVSTFFTLSGFLITCIALGEHASTGRFSLRQFWTRRFRRLLPAAIASIGAILLASFVFADSTQRTQIPGDAMASLFYVANWRFVFTGQSYGAMFQSPSPFTHFWTLSIEEQFYLLFPLVLAVTFVATRGSRKALAAVFGLLIASSTIWAGVLLAGGSTIDRIYFGTDTRMAELVAGSLLAVWWMRPNRRPIRVRLQALLGAGALLLMLALWVVTDQQQRFWYAGGLTLYACVTLVVIVGALQPRGPVRLLLAVKPLVWVGTVSYAAYLLHWPILLWLDRAAGLNPETRFVVGLALTLLLAGLFTRLVERPIRLGAVLPGRRAVMAVPIALVAVMALVVASAVTAPPDRTTVDFAAVQNQVDALTTGKAPAPDGQAQFGEWLRQQELLKTTTAPRVAFFGDSTALMNSMGFADWTFKDDLRTLAPQPGITLLGCGLLTGVMRDYQGQKGPVLPDCDDYVDQWRKAVTDEHVDVAVVQLGPWDVLDQQLTPGGPYLSVGNDPELDRLLEQKLRANVAMLLEHVSFVVLVAPPDIVSGMVDQRPPTEAFSESDPARMQRFREIVVDVADRTPHVAVADMQAFLLAQPDPWSIRADGVHPSPESSRIIGDWLGPEVKRLLDADRTTEGGT
jgi:peptidoglycan/LPS O-acetylase OafA/YrhL